MNPTFIKTTFLFFVPIILYFEVMKPLYTTGSDFFILPTPLEPISKLRLLSTEYDQALVQAKDLSEQAADLKKEYESLPEDTRNKVAVMLPLASSTQADPVRILDEVSTIISQSGFTPNSFSYQDISTKDKAGLGISFSVRGTYPHFKQLLETFENSLRLYVITSVGFSSPKGENGDTLSDFKINLETYYIK